MDELTEKYHSLAKINYIRAYRQINTLGNIFDFKMMVFLQPEVRFEDPNILSAEDRKIREITISLGGGHESFRHLLRNLIPGIFADAGLPFYNLGSIGSKEDENKQLYLDYCHLTPNGSRRVAEEMALRLWPQVQSFKY